MKITSVRMSDADGRARGFLLIVGGLFLIVFALPLLIAPLAIAGALLAVVHVIGAVRDAQPLSEDLEIAGYAAFALLALWCRPSRGQTP